MNKYDPQDPQITAYVFDELDESERAAFEETLASSPELQQAVEQTRCVLAVLESEIAEQPDESLADEQRTKIQAAIAESALRDSAPPSTELSPPIRPPEGSPPVVRRAREGRGRLWAVIAVVEAAALVVGGVIVFGGGPEYSSLPSTVAMRTPAADEQADGWSDMDDASVAEPAPASNVSGVEMTSSGKAAEPQGDTLASAPPAPQTSGLGALGNVGPQSLPQDARSQSSWHAPQAEVARHTGDGKSLRRGTDSMTAPVASSGMVPPSLVPQLRPRPAASSRDYFDSTGAAITSRLAGGPVGGMGGGGQGQRFLGWGDNFGTGVTPRGQGLARGETAPGDDSGLALADGRGVGPGQGGDRYERIVENEFLSPWDSPYSTFSIDVDTAAYSKVRMILNQSQLPRPDAVRIEELINYFPYSYEPPSSDESAPPFAARMSVSECPWNSNHRLVRIGVKGQEMAPDQRPSSNLVFLIDVSGSMGSANKLPLLIRGMRMLTEQLNENDTVSIAVYAGSAGLVLEPTNGEDQQSILDSLNRLKSGGSTNGGAGIKLAYKTALDNFIKGGVNRVILCTDGDFNVGVTGNDELVRLAESNAKDGVFLTVLGFGMGNHNDSMLEKVSNKGNGNYAFIDTDLEARKVLVEQMSSTLVTIAKDVKIQVEFNPERVAAYRLIGYENRILPTEDFNDDTKDAGEIGAGHAVTCLYEIVPKGAEKQPELSEVDELKYQRPRKLTEEAGADELLTLKMRYKKPDGDTSTKLEFPLKNKVLKFGEVDVDFRFTAAVASFGMLLRGSQFQGDTSYDAVLEIATEAAEGDELGYRTEFLELVKKAKMLSGN